VFVATHVWHRSSVEHCGWDVGFADGAALGTEVLGWLVDGDAVLGATDGVAEVGRAVGPTQPVLLSETRAGHGLLMVTWGRQAYTSVQRETGHARSTCVGVDARETRKQRRAQSGGRSCRRGCRSHSRCRDCADG
jgi:hypothetical protein